MKKVLTFFTPLFFWATLAFAVPAEVGTNNCTDTLNGAINNAVTSITVTSGTCFPSSGRFRIKIDSEIMIVDAISGTTLSTITRGAESTSAASHANLATVSELFTAGAWNASNRIEYNLCSGSGTTGTYQCYEQVTNHVPEVTCYLTGYSKTSSAQTCSLTANSAPGFANTSYIESNTRPIGGILGSLNSLSLPSGFSATDNLLETGTIVVKGQ